MFDAKQRWFALYTTPRHEKTVAAHLRVRCVAHYLPLYVTEHRWKNGVNAKLHLPLFPGYVFVCIPPPRIMEVLRIPGVLSIVTGTGHVPAPLDGEEIEILRVGLDAEHVRPHVLPAAGERVRIRRGALSGLEGVVVRTGNSFRIVLTIELIKRSIGIEIEADNLESAGSCAALALV